MNLTPATQIFYIKILIDNFLIFQVTFLKTYILKIHELKTILILQLRVFAAYKLIKMTDGGYSFKIEPY